MEHPNDEASAHLVQYSSDDESDVDEITDYLSESVIDHRSAANSPVGSKFNSIFEDTLNHLQSIRDSVVQMQNSSTADYHDPNTRQSPALSTSRQFSSCPSLPDLAATTANDSWSTEQATGSANDRRKSWTAIEDIDIDIEHGESSPKSEAYADLPQKPTKRPSLFFRKKKDKSKSKGQSAMFTCDGCGSTIPLSTSKDHMAECRAMLTKNQPNSKSFRKMISGSISHTQHYDEGRDFYDGHAHNNEYAQYSDEAPLISNELLCEPHITAQDLGGEPILGLMLENEPDLWVQAAPSGTLTDKRQIERQECIYEFIMTEKSHCQSLLLIQKVFVESMKRNFPSRPVDRLFPRLADLTALHTGFLHRLRAKQNDKYVVDSIADLMIDFFSHQANNLISAYGDYCSNHNKALDKIKQLQAEDRQFAEWYKYKESNPLLKRKGLNGFTLSVSHRLTKYPILIDAQIKKVGQDDVEREKLEMAKKLVKDILQVVNSYVAERNMEDRHMDIYQRIDGKSVIEYKNAEFRKADVTRMDRRLKFEGQATLVMATPQNSKVNEALVTVLVLTDVLIFLRETSQKYAFFAPSNQAGVVSLQKLLIRKDASDPRIVYFISTNRNSPEMYKLKIRQPKDANDWMKAIRTAVEECPCEESEVDAKSAEQEQKAIEAKHAYTQELIQEICQTASGLCRAVAALDLTSRAANATDDRPHAESSQMLKLPARAETFSAGDERRQHASKPHHHHQHHHHQATIGVGNWPEHSSDSMQAGGSVYQSQQSDIEALQLTHHMHTMLRIIKQEISTIANSSSQINAIRDNPRSMYRHNDQLEELRNLQDRIHAEKAVFEQQQRELNDQRTQLELSETKLRAEKVDIEQQRDELHKKLQILSNHGVLLSSSSNVGLSPMGIVSPIGTNDDGNHSVVHPSTRNASVNESDLGAGTDHRRNEKRRSSSTSKPPSVHTQSSGGTKVNQKTIKQQLPLKLASHSSAKSEKSIPTPAPASPIKSTNNMMTGSGNMVTQLLPLKLADKKQSQTISPSHSRTGSSPAAIQQVPISSASPTIRPNTNPKLPDRYRARVSDPQVSSALELSQMNASAPTYKRINPFGSSAQSPALVQTSSTVGQQIPRPIYNTPTSSTSHARYRPANPTRPHKSTSNARSPVLDDKDEEIFLWIFCVRG